jgi:hypothetical protein
MNSYCFLGRGSILYYPVFQRTSNDVLTCIISVELVCTEVTKCRIGILFGYQPIN